MRWSCFPLVSLSWLPTRLQCSFRHCSLSTCPLSLSCNVLSPLWVQFRTSDRRSLEAPALASVCCVAFSFRCFFSSSSSHLLAAPWSNAQQLERFSVPGTVPRDRACAAACQRESGSPFNARWRCSTAIHTFLDLTPGMPALRARPSFLSSCPDFVKSLLPVPWCLSFRRTSTSQ